MRRFRGIIAATFVLFAVALTGAAPAVAATGAADATDADVSASQAGTVAAVPASVDDFTFDSFDATYELGRDDAGHATLAVTETIVARFPQIDQNHGIRRAIPDHLQGHPIDLQLRSVTDGKGNPRSYDTDTDDDFLVVTIAADHYVHGVQTYVISYTAKDVALFPTDSTGEEFNWDVNGTGWAQPFGSVSARVELSRGLASSFTGQTTCFAGPTGSRDRCAALDTSTENGRTIVTARAADLGPHENLTVVVGFEQGTFVPFDGSFFASGFAIPLLVCIAGLIAGAVVAAWFRFTRWRNAPGRGTIIAEYEPPDLGVPMASTVYGKSGKWPTATLLDLAVRGFVRIRDVGTKRKPRYELELVTTEGLRHEEFGLLISLFPSMQPGRTVDLSKRNKDAAAQVAGMRSSLPRHAVDAGYRRKIAGPVQRVLSIVPWVLMVAGIVFGIIMLAGELGGPIPLALMAACVLLTIITSGLITTRPLTDAGAELRDHLKGLELYISFAEADRIRYLQSPSGAERRDAPDGAEVLRIYERLLPYAALFGQEKKWAEVLSERFESEGSTPGWYTGSHGFSAVVFATGVGAFASSAGSSSWAGSAASSGASGFGGGGGSGGGGGGGGGGGV